MEFILSLRELQGLNSDHRAFVGNAIICRAILLVPSKDVDTM